MDDSELKGPSAVIPDSAIETLARCLLPKIQTYFESPEGKAEFEKWQRERDNST